MTGIVPPLLTSVHPAPAAVRYWMGMARRIIRWVMTAQVRFGHSLLQFGPGLTRA
jgi:hypothetical protein